MKFQMSDDNKKKYDLEERTAKFGEEIIDFAKKYQNPHHNLTDQPNG